MLSLESAFHRAGARPGRDARGLDAQRLRQSRGHAGAGELAIAQLRALVARDDAHDWAEALEEARPLPRAETPRCRNVETQLDSRVRGVGVLAAGTPAPRETPFELVVGDDEAAPNLEGLVDLGHGSATLVDEHVPGVEGDVVLVEDDRYLASWDAQERHETKAGDHDQSEEHGVSGREERIS
jgi:hypothetical protein